MSLLLFLCLAAQDPAASLVEKLRSESVEERDDAARKLKELGAPALPELRKAIADKDAEVAGRARHLVRAIGLRGSLPARLFEAIPGLEDRLASDDPNAWTKALLELARVDAGLRPVYPKLRSHHLDPLAARAVEGAATPVEQIEVGQVVERFHLRAAVPALARRMGELGRALEAVAAPSDVPVLLDALKTVDAFDRQHLSVILGRIGETGALLRLREQIRSSGSAECLAEMGVREAIPEMAKLLADPEERLRQDAAQALAELGARDRAGAIVPLLASEDAYTRTVAAEALADLGARQAVPDLVRLLANPDDEVRGMAARALGMLRAKAAVVPLLARFKDDAEDEDVRCFALEALGEIGDREAVPAILAWVRKGGYLGRRAGYALEAMGSVEAIPEVVKLLSHENAEIRADSASLLGRLGDAGASAALRPLLRDASPDVRGSAAEALGRLRDRESDVRSMLKDAHPGARGLAALALVWLGAKDAGPELAALLADPESYVRANAAEAAGGLGLQELTPKLVPLLRDPDPHVRRTAASALGDIGAREAAPGVAALLDDDEFMVRAEAARTLGRLQARESLADLKVALTDSQAYVRHAAAGALCALGSSEGVWTILRERIDLTPLNALRQPEVWRRMRSKHPGEVRGTVREAAEAVAREAGLKVEWPAGEDWRWEGPPPRRGYPGLDLVDRLGDLLPRGAEIVLEKERVRVMLTPEARVFWRAWR